MRIGFFQCLHTDDLMLIWRWYGFCRGIVNQVARICFKLKFEVRYIVCYRYQCNLINIFCLTRVLIKIVVEIGKICYLTGSE